MSLGEWSATQNLDHSMSHTPMTRNYHCKMISYKLTSYQSCKAIIHVAIEWCEPEMFNSFFRNLWGAAGAMRSKTCKQVRKHSLRLKRWRKEFPWFVSTPHGLQCKVCCDAGVQSVWGKGESYSAAVGSSLIKDRALFMSFHHLHFWGCRGTTYVFASHLRQHAQSRTHRLAAPCLQSQFHWCSMAPPAPCNSVQVQFQVLKLKGANDEEMSLLDLFYLNQGLRCVYCNTLNTTLMCDCI